MSSVIYIASDFPLTERPNPHEKMVSVNEALALGIKVHDFLLEDGFDRDKPGVILVSDREVCIDADSGIIEDGDFDDDFSVWLAEKSCGMRTNKEYCAFLEMIKFTIGRAEQFIGYLKEQLKNTSEIEIWHAWLDDLSVHNVKTVKTLISIDNLKPEDIVRLGDTAVWQESADFTDYCYVITR